MSNKQPRGIKKLNGRKYGLANHNAAKILIGMENEVRVIELKSAGLTFQQIADELGYKNASGASEAYYRAIRAPPPNAAEAQAEELVKLRVREKNHGRMMRMLMAKVAEVEQGTEAGKKVDAYKCIDSFAKLDSVTDRIAIRRSNILGLDAPTKSSSTVDVTHKLDGDLIRSNLIAALDSLVSVAKDENAILVEGEVVQVPALTEGVPSLEPVADPEAVASEASEALPEDAVGEFPIREGDEPQSPEGGSF